MKADQAILKGDRWQYYLDGKRVTQKSYEKRYPPPKREEGQAFMCASNKNWPVISKLTLACDPSDVEARNDVCKANGITGVTYRPDGSCEISDASAYRRIRRFEGLIDKDGYY